MHRYNTYQEYIGISLPTTATATATTTTSSNQLTTLLTLVTHYSHTMQHAACAMCQHATTGCYHRHTIGTKHQQNTLQQQYVHISISFDTSQTLPARWGCHEQPGEDTPLIPMPMGTIECSSAAVYWHLHLSLASLVQS